MDEKLHRLLNRQLKKYFGSLEEVPEGLNPFAQAISEAYNDLDKDRALLERSLEISNRELFEANAEMRAVFKALPDLFFRLDKQGTILDCKGGDHIRQKNRPGALRNSSRLSATTAGG